MTGIESARRAGNRDCTGIFGYLEWISQMGAPDPAIAIANIKISTDKAWLQGFRTRMIDFRVPQIVEAIDIRLHELREVRLRGAVGKPLVDLTLPQRVHEAVRVYEEFLAYKHGGKRVGASRTRAMIKRWGEKEAVRRTVVNMKMSNGLELLAKHGRLDCAYEQIIIDFPDEFEVKAIDKARQNLARLECVGEPEEHPAATEDGH